ncbi:MAG: lipopolysaccharide transport system permease protein [Acidimicrobiaceae bacterium]|nr:lipopolysaccharide transport system permease protein [Acidimicrobiaceae bacterium]
MLDHRPVTLRNWLGGLWHFRGVLVALSRKDFQVRYKRATLGVLWSVSLPLLQSIVMVFIFSRVGRFGSGHAFSYAGFVLAGMVPWVFVFTSINASTTSIVDASELTDKVWFPRAILALVPPCANLLLLATATMILLAELPLVGVTPTARLLLLVPAAALAVAFASSVGLVLAALYVYFRDLKFMVAAVILVWLYLTPIVYPASALGSAGRWLDFNPLTGIVALFQTAAVGSPGPSARAVLTSIGATAVLTVFAVAIHRRHDRLFVDLL